MINLFYSLIFFTSDDPEKLHHFSMPFLNRLNQKELIQFSSDIEIENKYFLTAALNLPDKNFEKNLVEQTQLIKQYVLSNEFLNAETLANNEYQSFEERLLKNPYEISQSTLTNFYFWCAIANYKNEVKFNKFLNSFFGIATLSQRNILQSELPDNLYIYFEKAANAQNDFKFNTHTMTNSETCTLYFNGQKIKTKLTLPLNQEGILNAVCNNGIYKTRFVSLEDSTIEINPKIEKSLPSILPIEFFPIKLLKQKDIASLVFIYWSSKENYIQTIVVNPKRFPEKRELKLTLTSKTDLKTVGDKIEEFIFKSDKSLLN